MATREDVEGTRHTVEGLCGLARKLGYRDPLYQLSNRDGSVVGDLLYFFEDNPGACEAVIEWVLENHDIDEDEEVDPEACPSCGAIPGDGPRMDCHDMTGCGHWKALEK